MDRRPNPLNRSALLATALLCATAASAADIGALWSHQASAGTQLLPVDQAFALVSAERKHDRIEVTWSIAPGYYLYRKRLGFAVEPAGKAQTLGAAQLPAGTPMHDEQGDNEIYRNTLVAVLAIQTAHAPQRLRVRYQGCADAGVCYPPQTKLIDVVSTTPH
ncbi:MAG: thioredoxin family protein [Nevskia sp.]|nr:thioredoxin family protein [Nevskia sp.]